MLTTRASTFATALGLIFCALSAPALAGPLDISRLPTETRWVIHFDLEGLATSHLGRALAEKSGSPMRLDEDTIWGALSREIELDVAADLKSLTLVNSGEIPSDTVVLVVADEKIEKVFRRMPDLLPSHRKAEMNGHEIHTWTEIVDDRRDRWHAHVRPGPKTDQRLILLSQNWEQLLDVIEPQKNAAPPPAKLLALPQPGSLIFGAVSDLADSFDDEDAPWASGFAEAVQSLAFDLGEHEGAVVLRMLIVSHGEEEATTLAQMLQGMVAMGRLALANQPETERARAILAKVGIVAQGDQIRVSLAVPIETAVKSLNESDAFGELQLRRRSLDIGAGVRKQDAPGKDESSADSRE